MRQQEVAQGFTGVRQWGVRECPLQGRVWGRKVSMWLRTLDSPEKEDSRKRLCQRRSSGQVSGLLPEGLSDRSP